MIISALLALVLAFDPAAKQNRKSTPADAARNREGTTSIVIFENEKRDLPTKDNDQKPPAWSGTIEWSNWALAVVGVATVWAIWKQAKETAQATNAMRETVDLQKASMEQWVDIEPGGTETPGVSNTKPFEFRPMFEAVNNTPFPLTIRKIITKVSLSANEWETFTVAPYQILPPSNPDKKRSYPFFLDMTMPEIPIGWEQHGTVITVNGELTFVDCLQRIRTQQFGGLYRCGPAAFEYLKPSGIIAQHAQEYGPHPS